jgi:hypothetical protein
LTPLRTPRIFAAENGVGWRMGVISYRCPNSGDDVSTSIQTSKDTLVKMRAMDLTIWVWCPHCMAGHQIKPAEAVFEGEMMPMFGPPITTS